jgi:hypothetical protein
MVDLARGERPGRIVSQIRFAADHPEPGSHLGGGDRGATEQAPDTDRCHDDVEVADVGEELQGRGTLTGDDPGVVVGVDLDRTGPADDVGLRRLPRRLAPCDQAAVAGDRRSLDVRSVAGHDDVGGDPPDPGGQGERLGVISRRVADHAVGGLGLGQREHRIAGATELEGADLLEVLALEVDLVRNSQASRLQRLGNPRSNVVPGIVYAPVVTALKAHVTNGRIVVDDPVDLPEGAEIQVYLYDATADAMSREERAALDRALEISLSQADAGDLIDADEVLAELQRP